MKVEKRCARCLPANKMRPINSLRPILSKSMTIISNEHSRIFSHGTLKLNDSLNIGFKVHLNIGVFRFSIRLSPNCSQTLTYGSIRRKSIKTEQRERERGKEEKKSLEILLIAHSTLSNNSIGQIMTPNCVFNRNQYQIPNINFDWDLFCAPQRHHISHSPDFPLISFAFKFRALINDRVKIEFDG